MFFNVFFVEFDSLSQLLIILLQLSRYLLKSRHDMKIGQLKRYNFFF